jgi:hypothetical protein
MPGGVIDILVYGVPILAGIVGRKHLTRSANFCLMIAVCQFDVAFLPVVVFGWQVRPKMFLPYAVIIVAMAGIMASKDFGKVVNAVFVPSPQKRIGLPPKKENVSLSVRRDGDW